MGTGSTGARLALRSAAGSMRSLPHHACHRTPCRGGLCNACRSWRLLGPRQATRAALQSHPRRRRRRCARAPPARRCWRCPRLARLPARPLPQLHRTSARRRRGRCRRGAPPGRRGRHWAKRGRRRIRRASAHQQGRRPAARVCLRRQRQRRRRRRPREPRSGPYRRPPVTTTCAVRHGVGRRQRLRSSGRLRGRRPAGGRCRRGRQRARRSRRWASACRWGMLSETRSRGLHTQARRTPAPTHLCLRCCLGGPGWRAC